MWYSQFPLDLSQYPPSYQQGYTSGTSWYNSANQYNPLPEHSASVQNANTLATYGNLHGQHGNIPQQYNSHLQYSNCQDLYSGYPYDMVRELAFCWESGSVCAILGGRSIYKICQQVKLFPHLLGS